MAVVRSARAQWQGNLTEGSGSVSSLSSAHLRDLPISWSARTEDPAGLSGPEELLAAAHASCYCMQLSHELAEAGTPPGRLEATATVDFEPGEGVRSSRLVVSGQVDGIDQDTFAAAAASASENCPISGALKGNLEITVEATLRT